MSAERIAIGCDHAGFPYKRAIMALLESLGIEVLDFGAHSEDSVDYPDFVHPVADRRAFIFWFSARSNLHSHPLRATSKIVEIIQQGQSFGEAIMFLDRTYIVFAQALQDSMLIHVPKAAILNELEHDYEFTRKMLAGPAKRTHDLMTDVEAYSLQSAKQRIIGYLMIDVPQAAIDSDQLEFELTVSKGVIASRLNITQEHSVSRVLHDLSDSGLLEVHGKKIRIPSVSKLLKTQDNP